MRLETGRGLAPGSRTEAPPPQIPATRSAARAPTTNAALPHAASSPGPSSKILRFLVSERFMHWSLALPFVLLYASALLMFAFWGEPQPRLIHTVAGWIHRVAGVCLIVFPPLAIIRGRADWRMHVENMREGWIWHREDIRWLILFPKAAADSRIALPEQGKFNAAEKLNFMMVSATYPLYIATGLLIWSQSVAFFPWLAHVIVAVMGMPLIGGHIFMATINPSTRIGLSGMFTGMVDREWAKHHYRSWYRRHFEGHAPAAHTLGFESLLQRPAMIRCDTCNEMHTFPSWEHLLQRVFQVEPLFCPKCESEIGIVSAEADPEVAEAILHHLATGGANLPFREGPASAA